MPPRWFDRTRSLIEASKDETRALIEASREETRVLIAASREETRALIEAWANDKLGRFQSEVRREFRRVDRRILRLEARG